MTALDWSELLNDEGERLAAKLPANSTSARYELGRTVKGGPGLLCGFTAYSSNVAAQFVQVFDLSSFAALTSASVPECVFPVAATAIAASVWLPPRTFRSGIVIANSSTANVYTAGSADTLFDCQYV